MATKVSKSLISNVDVSQINTTGSDAGKVLTSNGSTLNWVISSAVGGAPGAPLAWYDKYKNGAVFYHTAAPGTGTWTAPSGVTRALVACVGGSAGCGSNPYGGNTVGSRAQGGSSNSNNMAGGGGGGSWAIAEVAVVPGTTYVYSVGTSGGIGSNGTSSRFNTTADSGAAINQVIAGGGITSSGITGGRGGNASWNGQSAAGGAGSGSGGGGSGSFSLGLSGAGGGGGGGGAGRGPNAGGGGGGGGFSATGVAAPGAAATGTGGAGGSGVAYYDELFITNNASSRQQSSFVADDLMYSGELTMFSLISAAASSITSASGFVMIRW